MTETGSIMGTAQYLSPEQAQGQPVDARSDLYSIGVVLYELLTGVVPFDAESPVTIALKQVSEAPVPAIQRNPAMPPALDAVVMRALRKDPDARFQDADEFIAALEQALDGGYVERTVVEEEVAEDDGWQALAGRRAGRARARRHRHRRLPAAAHGHQARAQRRRQARGERGADPPDARASRWTSCRSSPTRSRRTASPGQDPAPGEEAEVGSEVTINVSSGPGEALVPLVQGLPVDEATDKLREAGFKTERRDEFSDTVKKGRVIDDLPAGGPVRAQGLHGHARRLARQGEDRRCPTWSASSRTRPSATLSDAGFEVEHDRARGRRRRAGHRARAGPGGRHAGREGGDA